MEKTYWLSRRAESLEHARSAASAEARSIHYDLAERYARNAASAETEIFDLTDSLPPPILPRGEPSNERAGDD